MVATRETEVYRRTRQGDKLDPKQREELARPYLPREPSSDPEDVPSAGLLRRALRRLAPVRAFVRNQIHLLIFTIMHTFFSFYIVVRQTYNATLDHIFATLYYHHRTPELIKRDVQDLDRLPEHLSVILSLDDAANSSSSAARGRRVGTTELERLMDEVAEIAAWCACADIPMLSIYEPTGRLKRYMPSLSNAVSSKLRAYFGPKHPNLQLGAPHMGTYFNGELLDKTHPSTSDSVAPPSANLSLLLISSEDGRESVVDLTKTLAEMSQRGKISASDINLTLVDAELTENVMDEPDLLILFDSEVRLRAYPPWQLRLTEIL
ncbi:MAG: hypothetical protein M1837_002591 [Sclerophora amabilis]|nr:MAG: hypothetical protein M1837_002591 [Sclerophora amabilis]